MFIFLHANMNGGLISHHGHSHRSKYEQLDDSNDSNKQVMNQDKSFGGEITPGHNQEAASKQSKNINVHAAMIHVIGDFVQSIGVLVAAILIKINV
jgi:Co/Zn/Cd efflux system component